MRQDSNKKKVSLIFFLFLFKSFVRKPIFTSQKSQTRGDVDQISASSPNGSGSYGCLSEGCDGCCGCLSFDDVLTRPFSFLSSRGSLWTFRGRGALSVWTRRSCSSSNRRDTSTDEHSVWVCKRIDPSVPVLIMKQERYIRLVKDSLRPVTR